jgi:hypothetical protein
LATAAIRGPRILSARQIRAQRSVKSSLKSVGAFRVRVGENSPATSRQQARVTARPASRIKPRKREREREHLVLLYASHSPRRVSCVSNRSCLSSPTHTYPSPQSNYLRPTTPPPPLLSHSGASPPTSTLSAARALRRGNPLVREYTSYTCYICRRIRLPTSFSLRLTTSPVRRRVAHTLQRL